MREGHGPKRAAAVLQKTPPIQQGAAMGGEGMWRRHHGKNKNSLLL
jgi:hypothetical protein